MEKISIIIERDGDTHGYNRTADKLTNTMILAFLEKAPRILAIECICKDVPGRTWSCECPQHGNQYTQSKVQGEK